MPSAPSVGWIPSSRDSAVASVRLRCLLPSRYLREAGWHSELLDEREPYRYDVVVFQKMYDEEAIELARSLKARGVRTVFDLCDNHFYNPDAVPKLAERAERLRRMLDVVDLVSVSTEPLRELVSDKETELVDDALDELCVPVPTWRERVAGRVRRGGRPLRLVWYGGAGLESPSFGLAHIPRVLPALEEAHRVTPLSLTVISNSRAAYHKFVGNTGFPSEYREWDYTTFPRLFAAHDVCIIPIEVNPFTVCKTANRVALSLRLGVPVIADRIPSFDQFSSFVLLDDWSNNIAQYAQDAELRERHVVNGHRHVEATYTRGRVVAQWSGVFEQVLGTVARTVSQTFWRAG